MPNILLFSPQDLLFFSFTVAIFLGTILLFVFLYSKADQLSSKYLINFLKRRSLQLLVAFVVLFLAIFSTFLALQYMEKLRNEPIKSVTASELKKEKASALAILQSKGTSSFKKASLYVVDLRSQSDFAKDGLKGSFNKPAVKAKQELYFLDGIDLVIFSYANDLSSVQEVASAAVRNGQKYLSQYKNPGKIIIVKDGFEGLKKLGLSTGAGGLE